MWRPAAMLSFSSSYISAQVRITPYTKLQNIKAPQHTGHLEILTFQQVQKNIFKVDN